MAYKLLSWLNHWIEDSLLEGQFAIKTDSSTSSCCTATFVWFGGGCNEVGKCSRKGQGTNEFTTVAASSGARLPSPEQGEFIFVANAGANALSVYPATGHSINALAANAAFSLAVGKNALFWAATASKWYAILSA